MPDPNQGGIISVRQIVENADYVANWITGLVISGGLSLLVATIKDKLTFIAICTAFFTSTFLFGITYPSLIAYGYSGLISMTLWALTCGAGGFALLLLLVSVIRKFIEKDGKRIAERAFGSITEGKDA